MNSEKSAIRFQPTFAQPSGSSLVTSAPGRVRLPRKSNARRREMVNPSGAPRSTSEDLGITSGGASSTYTAASVTNTLLESLW